MHTLTINVNDSFYPHFKALIKSLAQNKKLEYFEERSEKELPEEILINDKSEVKKRVLLAEARIASGSNVEEEAFWKTINRHIEKYAD